MLGAALAGSAAAGPLADRQPDPVVVAGAVLGEALLGGPLDRFVLLARSAPGASLEPIPFQLDQRDADGRLVLADGSAPGDDGDGHRLDANDELVFLARDAGLRSHEWPADAEQMAEIRVVDGRSGREAWTYLVAVASGSPVVRSPDRYVEFDAERRVIAGASYRLGFTDPRRPHTPTFASLPGGDVDILDSAKVRLRGRLFGFMTITRTDDDFESTDVGTLIGPIRVVRVIESRIRLIGRVSAAGAEVVRIYYPEWVEAPVPISLPFKVESVFHEPEVFYGVDFDLPRDGSHRYYSDRFPAGVPIGGPEAALHPSTVPADEVAWQGVAGPLGAVFSAVRLPASVPVTVETVFEVNDDVDEPEDVRGAAPLVGRRLVDWENVEGGLHVAHFYEFYPTHYQAGDEEPFLRMLAEPLQTSALPLARTPAVSARPDDPSTSERVLR